jgi:hypothetical protein
MTPSKSRAIKTIAVFLPYKAAARIKIAVLAVLLIAAAVWADAAAPSSVPVGASWQSGETTVTLNGGVLTVSGEGAMGDYDFVNGFLPPWYDFRDSIISVFIEYGVTSVGNYAFANCAALERIKDPDGVTSVETYVTIPNSVAVIGDGAFYGCAGLTEAKLPRSVTVIGNYAFDGCARLTDVSTGDRVATIGEGAFRGCAGLTSFLIPDSVTKIGAKAFWGCTGLEWISVYSPIPPEAGDDAFYGVDKGRVCLHLHHASKSSRAAYRAAEGWGEFKCVKDVKAEGALSAILFLMIFIIMPALGLMLLTYILFRFIFQKIRLDKNIYAKIITIIISIFGPAILLFMFALLLSDIDDYGIGFISLCVGLAAFVYTSAFLYLAFKFIYKRLNSKEGKICAWIIVLLCQPVVFIAGIKLFWHLFLWIK